MHFICLCFFFFLSGYVYKSKDADSFFSGKLKSLLLPIIFFEGFNLFIFVILKVINFEKYYDKLAFGGVWFPLSLIYIVSIYYLIDNKLVKKSKFLSLVKIFSAVVFLVVGLLYAKRISDTPNQPIATAMVGYFFFTIGNLFAMYVSLLFKEIKIKRIIRFLCFVIGIILFVVLYLFIGFTERNVDMYSSRYGNSILFIINALLGSFGLLFFSLGIGKSRILEYYGKNTLMLLFVHHPIWRCSDYLLDKLGLLSGGYKSFVVFIISLTVGTFLVWIINRYFPWLTGKIEFSDKDIKEE